MRSEKQTSVPGSLCPTLSKCQGVFSVNSRTAKIEAADSVCQSMFPRIFSGVLNLHSSYVSAVLEYDRKGSLMLGLGSLVEFPNFNFC